MAGGGLVAGSIVSHLTAQPVLVAGRFRRQLCAWCGVAIVDEDLSRRAYAVDGDSPPFVGTEWPSNEWVRIVTDGAVRETVVFQPEPGKFPEDSCMATFVKDLQVAERRAAMAVAIGAGAEKVVEACAVCPAAGVQPVRGVDEDGKDVLLWFCDEHR